MDRIARRLDRVAARTIRAFGYELVSEFGTGGLADQRVSPRRLPDTLPLTTRVADPYRQPFPVPIERMATRLGFSFAEDGWNPLVETLREYIADPGIDYDDTTLARLFERFQPRTVQEVLFEDVREPMKPLSDWPAVNAILRWVWALTPGSAAAMLRRVGSEPRGWVYYGPHPREEGKRRFERLVGVYESLRERGYDQRASDESPVTGYFLLRDGNFRFILKQGNHRLAAMRVLGYPTVGVVIPERHHAVIDHAELARWTIAQGGVYPPEVAERLFDRMFSETGTGKAERLGLLEK